MSSKKTSYKFLRILIFVIGLGIFFIGILGIKKRFDPIAEQFSVEINRAQNQRFEFTEIYKKYLSLGEQSSVYEYLLGKLDSFAEADKYQLLQLLFQLRPNNIELNNYVKNILLENKSSLLVPLSISHLAIVEKEWLKGNIYQFLEHGELKIRLAAVNSLFALCPENVSQILEKFIDREVNENVVRFVKKKMKESSYCVK